MAIQTIDPTSNKVVKTFEALSKAQTENRLQLARDAFKKWRDVTLNDRSVLMRKCADILLDDKDRYASLMTLEMGKPVREARAEIEKCASVCLYYADNAQDFLKNEPAKTDAHESYVRFDPLGTVLAIMPWNFPFWQVFRFAAPTLMAGNTGLLKHASNVPQCALAIEEVFTKAGFAEGIFQTLLVESDAVEAIINDNRVQAVTLTGSEGAGAKVGAQAGKALKKTVLELGGSDAFIVLQDANLDAAAKTAAKSRMINTGQSCIAAKRFIVAEQIAEEFTEKMKRHMLALQPGDLQNEVTDYGPMAREDLAEELLKQVQKSVDKGAKIICGGNRPGKPGAYFNPTILANVTPGMPAFDEEMFGPVAAIITANSEQHAIELANQSCYGLGASVWTENTARAQEMARQIEAGAVFINALVKSDPRMPFGGIKRSGYGRELSYFGIREFVNQKTVWVDEAAKSDVANKPVNEITE